MVGDICISFSSPQSGVSEIPKSNWKQRRTSLEGYRVVIKPQHKDLKSAVWSRFGRSGFMKTSEEIDVAEDYTPPSKPNAKSERLPVSEFYKVLDYYTIFKSDKWWEAIALIETFGKRSIAMYMWQFRDGNWKRKHKFQIRGVNEWAKVRRSVEQLLPKLTGQDNKPIYAKAHGANSR